MLRSTSSLTALSVRCSSSSGIRTAGTPDAFDWRAAGSRRIRAEGHECEADVNSSEAGASNQPTPRRNEPRMGPERSSVIGGPDKP
jgi:hypothetical protein